MLDRRILAVLQRLMANSLKPRPTGPYNEDDIPDDRPPDEACDALYEVPPHLFIGGAFDQYMEAHDYRKSPKHISLITSAFNEFMTASKLHENLTLHHITKDTGRTWIAYMRTPKKFPARAVPKAVTIDSKIKMVRQFLQWCVAQDWLEANPFADLALPSRVVSASRQNKEAFTDPQLAVIFQALKDFPSRPLQRMEGRTEFYYAVLLLAFTGARCNEIVQLDTKDVRQVDGIWIVDIWTQDDDGKRLKNKSSRRKVPIHSQLLPVFLPWFQQQTGSKLFPALDSTLVSRWFSKGILLPTGIKRPALSLHSLRHTMTHKLIHARTYPPIQNRLLGHALGKSVEMTAYTRGLEFSVKELSEALEKVSYPMPHP